MNLRPTELAKALSILTGTSFEHDVIVVAHDGIGAEIDGEYRAKQFDAVNNPLAAVLTLVAGFKVWSDLRL
jgi:hypothetical protein